MVGATDRRVGTDWFVTDADTPAVIRLSNGTLAANWMQSSSDEFEASNLRLSYSTDDGKTWSRSFLPHHDGTITQHAFASLSKYLGKDWVSSGSMGARPSPTARVVR